jgi:hypothetical protein
MDAVEGQRAEMGDMLRKMAEKDEKTVDERRNEANQLEKKLMSQLQELRNKVDEWKEGRTEVKAANGKREKRVTKCIIITDSNGREATADNIMRQIPEKERDGFDIEVVMAYTLEGALGMIRRGEIKTKEAVVVVDNLTNNVRGTKARPRTTPVAVAERLGELLDTMWEAQAVVVCEVKPMQHVDVTPYNIALHMECVGREGVHGCHTQTRLGHLAGDGFHIRAAYASVLERTYACALLGIPVPFQTPPGHFAEGTHQTERGKFEREWPRPGGEPRQRNFPNVWELRQEWRNNDFHW